jgi:type I restriction enzyme S subunit
MNEICRVKIAELGQTITGKTPSSENPEDFGSEYMFVTPSDSFDKKMMDITERYLSEEGVKKLSKKLLPPKSIMITCIGSAMGKVAMNETSCITNQQINSIIPKKSYCPDYVYYAIKNNYKVLRNAATGSTALPLLNKTDFDILEFLVHKEKVYQQNISSVLSPIDAKIALNNRINLELEDMAKTLYDYWFVQFDFPNEQGKPYKSSGGIMVYNTELKREIPEGWEVKTLAKWIKTDKSGDWGKEAEEGNYQLKVSCVRGADLNGLNGNGEQKPPTRFILENNSNKLLENHDLIVEISGGSPTQSTGRLAFITGETLQRFPNPLICSNFCKALTLKEEKYLYNFVYQWNRIYDNGVLFGWEGKTSGIKNLLFESFVTNHKEAYPKSEIVAKFYDFAKPLHSQKQKNLIQNQQLSELRDWLLPMLMNGQVTVKEAEERLSMAAEPSIMYHIKANNNSK